ncbi:hypothetical protein GLOIN_2v1700217 [Rhizophagus irregularis DAOM 181602=DAOM 197198]|uniref:Uncharacterized protein n=4 Tax=Rhizophagus irregularis TaxID=588596 RepID=A0A015K6Q1_RHIIW|nr:hypothetical protein RirG_155010 [Rhizophagus irregularis DAOM 197198w]GBC18460.1 hypothetical protein GLOIN_2v1700217 [Rhizophagus irregularis DAOM 181602=DAOM 197198]CAB4495369.1 unnamed protein product [Rhizophagus irregularis]CAG8604085.1 18862_t:CDS:1 [Rhizophagus irregularis]
MDSLGSNPYDIYDWYETLNGKTGIFAIAVVIIFVSIIIITFIVRIIQFPHLRQQVINYFIADCTQSAPTRILKMIIFLFLTAGLVGVIYFNVYKMVNYPPKLSMSLEENDSFPSMLFCPVYKDASFEIVSANYYESVYNINNKNPLVNLIDSKVFQDIPGDNSDCKFFNGTLFPSFLKKKNFAGGVYILVFNRFNSSSVVIYMGDNNVDWINFIPQGKKFSDVESITLQTEGRNFQYTETRIRAINGTIYRNFQMSFKGNLLTTTDDTVGLMIKAPARVTTMILRPSLTLVELFSNIGGYLSIWGIVVFLFGRGKMDPFGFVSRFVFIEQDKTKLLKELKKINYDKSIKQNKIDIVTETSNLDDQVELENLLAKYYIHMDFYKHAVKTSDV